MTEHWNTTTVDPSQEPEPLSAQVLSENLGHTSQFVGLMDTEDKVRGHLDAVAQYQTIYNNLLHNGEFSPDEINRAYCSTWVACDNCESPHGACVDVCAKAGRVVDTFGFGPEMDAALAADEAKLVALGAYDPQPAADPGYVPAQQPYNPDQHWEVQHPQPQAQPQARSPQPAVELETARLTWKDAVAKRNALMAQWDAYVAECRAHYQRLKTRQ